MAEIDRTGAEALIPREDANQVIQNALAESIVLSQGRRLPNMQTGQKRLPVLDVLPIAYFNNANADPNDTSFKQTSRAAWQGLSLDAEEISVIIPIAENVLNDSNYDIWGQVRPLIAQAIGAKIDAAVLFGVDAPNIWPDSILAGATAAGNTVGADHGTDLYDAILSEGGLFSLVENDGYMVTANATYPGMKAQLRGLRGADGLPIFQRADSGRQDVQAATNYELAGTPVYFTENGAWDATAAEMISGDFRKLVYAIRQDITTKLLTEAVIQDPTDGSIVYNLAQQDMVALRVVMRLAWQVPNPANLVNTDDASRYPFAVLTPAGGS